MFDKSQNQSFPESHTEFIGLSEEEMWQEGLSKIEETPEASRISSFALQLQEMGDNPPEYSESIEGVKGLIGLMGAGAGALAGGMIGVSPEVAIESDLSSYLVVISGGPGGAIGGLIAGGKLSGYVLGGKMKGDGHKVAGWVGDKIDHQIDEVSATTFDQLEDVSDAILHNSDEPYGFKMLGDDNSWTEILSEDELEEFFGSLGG